ncbi:MAG: hypothetical protein KAR21_01740 [Spirochaetales bacterium]|nr:hypothetical protein [Spirochaetales bacterium]
MNIRLTKNRIKLAIRAVIGKKLFEQINFWREVGFWPEVQNPETFCEYVSYLKLYDHNPGYVEISDKYLVREYVKGKIGESYLSRLHAVIGKPEDLPEDLPENFVLKATYGSGINHFETGYTPGKRNELLEQADKMLRRRHLYGELSGQWWYKKISRRLIVEERIADSRYSVPIDYKFYCFGGKPSYIQVDSDRFGAHTRTFFDCSWNKQDFSFTYPPIDFLPAPRMLEKMTELAAVLSKDWEYMRVDFYNPTDEERIIFGELTLAPQAGWIHFSPDHMKADLLLGNLWKEGIKNSRKARQGAK